MTPNCERISSRAVAFQALPEKLVLVQAWSHPSRITSAITESRELIVHFKAARLRDFGSSHCYAATNPTSDDMSLSRVARIRPLLAYIGYRDMGILRMMDSTVPFRYPEYHTVRIQLAG